MTQAVFDKALELRSIASGAVVATGLATPLAVPVGQLEPCSWVVHVSAAASGSGNETYVFALSVALTSGGTYTTIAQLNWPRAHQTGKLHVPISGDLSKFLVPKAAWMQVGVTLGGTSPSITYGSYLSKSTSGLGVAARPVDTLTYAT